MSVWAPMVACSKMLTIQSFTTTYNDWSLQTSGECCIFTEFQSFSQLFHGDWAPAPVPEWSPAAEMHNDAQDFRGSHEQIGKDLVLSCYLCLFGSSSVPTGVIPQPLHQNHALCKSTATNSKLLRWGCMEICHDNSTHPVSHSKHCHADGFPSTSAWQTGCFTT